MIITGCLSIMLLNMTEFPINKNDITVFERGQETCKTGTYQGCIAKFIKKGKRSYHISCGEKMQLNKKVLQKQKIDAILYELRHLSVEETKKAMEKIGITEW
jgi:hypothetical protein